MPALGGFKQLELGQLSDLAKQEYLSRQTEIGERWSYYKRKQKKWIIDSKSGKPTSENVIINVTKKIVDQTVSFLFGKTPKISAGDQYATEIEELLDINRESIFFTNLGKEGAISGHCFVKIVPNEAGGVQWVTQSTQLVSAFWRPDNAGQAIGYKIEWNADKTDFRQDIIFLPEQQKWLIRELKRGDRSEWIQAKEDVMWNFSFPPIIDWQNLPDNSNFYGESDITAIDLNDSINFTASNVNRILKYHAHPRTVGTGIKAEEIKETSVDGFWTTENENAQITNLEMISDLSSSMNYLHFLRGSFFSEQNAVDLDSVKDKLGDLTNFALKVLFNDAIAKNNTKQNLYEYGIKELVYRSLVVMGKQINARDVDVEFFDPLPINAQEMAQTTQLERESGFLSKQTAAEKNGIDWKTEQKRIAAEKEAEDINLGQTLLDAINKFDNGQNGQKSQGGSDA